MILNIDFGCLGKKVFATLPHLRSLKLLDSYPLH